MESEELADTHKIEEALRSLHRGLDVSSAHASFGDGPPLHPDEERIATAFISLRRAQFECGRVAARAALAKAGIVGVGVASTVDGVPIFPKDFVGSISHKALHAVAAVASGRSFRALGIDLEIDEDDDEHELLERVCTANERSLIQKLEQEHICSPATLFLSAKEAVYKALFPLERLAFDFEEIEIALDATDRTFWVRRLFDAPRPEVRGTYALAGRWLICLVIIDT